MKFPMKWKVPKLSKTRSNKKIILATLKGGTKWLAAGLLMGTGAEIASHVASKTQGDSGGALGELRRALAAAGRALVGGSGGASLSWGVWGGKAPLSQNSDGLGGGAPQQNRKFRKVLF